MLILHVGFPKCGSSSIQSFLKDQKALPDKYQYFQISIGQIKIIENFLDQKIKIEGKDSSLEKVLAQIRKGENLIISNEALFSRPDVIEYLVSLNKKSKTIVIGYVRKYSSWQKSSFNQWYFRISDLPKQIKDSFSELGLSTTFFTPLEQYLIHYSNSLTIEDFGKKEILWSKLITELKNKLEPYEASISINGIPTSERPYQLVDDFLDRCDFSENEKLNLNTNIPRANSQFDNYLIQGIFFSSFFQLDKYDMHKGNKLYHAMSKELGYNRGNISELEQGLLDYIDSYFFNSNKFLAHQFEIPESYFMPNEFKNREELITLIRSTEHSRKNNSESLIIDLKQNIGELAKLAYNQQEEIESRKQKVKNSNTLELFKKLIFKITK